MAVLEPLLLVGQLGFPEGDRFGEDVDNDQQLAVPAGKSLQFFHCNPFTCYFTQHYPHGSLEFLRKKQPTYRGSEAEERFLELVKWRATFPLSVGSSDQKDEFVGELGRMPELARREYIRQLTLGYHAVFALERESLLQQLRPDTAR